jgi:hypothetical protein
MFEAPPSHHEQAPEHADSRPPTVDVLQGEFSAPQHDYAPPERDLPAPEPREPIPVVETRFDPPAPAQQDWQPPPEPSYHEERHETPVASEEPRPPNADERP